MPAKAMKIHADDIRAVASQTTDAFIKYMKESSAVEGEAQRKHDRGVAGVSTANEGIALRFV